jgi:hypothetical protein
LPRGSQPNLLLILRRWFMTLFWGKSKAFIRHEKKSVNPKQRDRCMAQRGRGKAQSPLGLQPVLPSDQIPGFGILQQFGLLSVHVLPNKAAQPSLDPCLWKTTNETLNSRRGIAHARALGQEEQPCGHRLGGCWVPRKFNRW